MFITRFTPTARPSTSHQRPGRLLPADRPAWRSPPPARGGMRYRRLRISLPRRRPTSFTASPALKQVMNPGQYCLGTIQGAGIRPLRHAGPGSGDHIQRASLGPQRGIRRHAQPQRHPVVSDSTGMVVSPFFTANRWETGEFTISRQCQPGAGQPVGFQVTIQNSGVYFRPSQAAATAATAIARPAHAKPSPGGPQPGCQPGYALHHQRLCTNYPARLSKVAKQFYLEWGWGIPPFTVQNGRTKLYGVEDTTYHFNIVSGEDAMHYRDSHYRGRGLELRHAGVQKWRHLPQPERDQ